MESDPQLCQLIFYARRNGRKYPSRNQAIPFQLAESKGQHPLSDAANQALELIETARTISEEGNNQHCPLIADQR